MTISVNAPAVAGHIEFSALSACEWRISDRRVPTGDAGSVLGFVELSADEEYELLELGHGHGIKRFTFASLREVGDHFLHSNNRLDR